MADKFFLVMILAQGVGLAAMTLDLYGAAQKSDRRLVSCLIASTILFAVHFSLLAAWPAALSELITALRFYLSRIYKNFMLCGVFIALYCMCAFFFAGDVWGLMPFGACILGTLAVFCFDGIRMRLLFMGGQSLWLVYAIHVFSLGGIGLYSAVLVITATTIFRIKKSPPAGGDFKEPLI